MVEGSEVTTGSPEGSTKYILSDADSLESHSIWGGSVPVNPHFSYTCLISWTALSSSIPSEALQQAPKVSRFHLCWWVS